MAVESSELTDFIGMVYLDPETTYTKDGRADLGYFLLPEYWGNGYATEASLAMMRYGFEILELNKITAGCLAVNASSEKVMIRCHMKKEAEYRKHTVFNGFWVNRVEYAILREEFLVVQHG